MTSAKLTTYEPTNSSKKVKMIKLLPPSKTDNPKKKSVMKRIQNKDQVSTKVISTKLGVTMKCRNCCQRPQQKTM